MKRRSESLSAEESSDSLLTRSSLTLSFLSSEITPLVPEPSSIIKLIFFITPPSMDIVVASAASEKRLCASSKIILSPLGRCEGQFITRE